MAVFWEGFFVSFQTPAGCRSFAYPMALLLSASAAWGEEVTRQKSFKEWNILTLHKSSICFSD